MNNNNQKQNLNHNPGTNPNQNQNQDYRRFDTAYRAPINQMPGRPANDDELYYRKKGFDLGTILWPFLMVVVYLASNLIVSLVVLFVRLFSDPVLLQEMQNVIDNNQAFMQLLLNLLTEDFVLTAAIYSVLQIIIFVAFLMWRNRREENYVLNERFGGLSLTASIFIALGSLGLSQMWMVFAQFLSEHLNFFENAVNQYGEITVVFSADNEFMLILSVAILVPIAEELLFRGVLLGELRRLMPSWVGVVVVGVLFGIFHGNLIQGVYAAGIGIILGLVYVWTDSIWSSILMHIVFNFFGGALPLILEKHNVLTMDEETLGLIMLVSYIIFMILGLIFFILVFRKRGEEKRVEPMVKKQYIEAGVNPEVQNPNVDPRNQNPGQGY